MATSTGWCPFAEHRPSPTFGYPQRTHGQNEPRFIVSHTMMGWKRTLDDIDWQVRNEVGVHFGVGLDESISQYASIWDAHWGNGVSGDVSRYDRSNRHLRDLEGLGTWQQGRYANGTPYWYLVRGVVNVLNSHSISIEHEDGGNPLRTAWPEAQVQATIRLHRWIVAECKAAGRPLTVDGDLLVGHHQIDPRDRVNCPGPGWPKARILAALLADATPDAQLREEEDEMQLVIQEPGTLNQYLWVPPYLHYLSTPVGADLVRFFNRQPEPVRLNQEQWEALVQMDREARAAQGGGQVPPHQHTGQVTVS